MSSLIYSIDQIPHDPSSVDTKIFESETGGQRTFVLLKSSGSLVDPKIYPGLTIVDMDHGKIVMDGLCWIGSAPSAAYDVTKELFLAMTWPEFSRFVKRNPKYKGGIADIDELSPKPKNGSDIRISIFGTEDGAKFDIRSKFIREISADPTNPYHFPPSSRMDMEREISGHMLFNSERSPASYIAWDIRMNFPWNRSGIMKGGVEVSKDQNANWRAVVENDPSVVRQAADMALQPYLSGPVSILEMNDFKCEFELMGANSGFLILKRFCGHFMSKTRDVSILNRISQLSDAKLEALWVAIRVLDLDLSKDSRAKDMEICLHKVRVAMESKTKLKV